MATADPPAKSKRRFFVMTPQLVWALSRNPYDFMLWNVVKMAAWDTGECILSTRDLATLSMMSVGKVQDCRAYLLRMGLLEGEFRRDPGYPQPVYHLRVPDLWQRNQQLIDSGLGHSLKKRVAFKAAQRELPALPLPAEQGAAPGEQGLPPNEQAVPPGEQGLPPGEQGILPGETNKIRPDTSETLEGQRRAGLRPPDPPQGGTLSLAKHPPLEGPPASPPNPPHPVPRFAGRQGGTSDFSPPLGGYIPSPVEGPGGPPPDLHPLLLRLCRYEPDVVSGYRRKQLQEVVRRLQAHRVGPGDLAAFERWWYGHDWRGKRGEPPEPGAILDTWGRFKYQPQPQEVSYGRGYRFARPEEFGLA